MQQKISPIFILFSCIILTFNSNCQADQTLTATRSTITPIIDGIGNDRAWKQGTEIETFDRIANVPILLTALYTNDMIFFRIVFPDPDASITHKSWIWNTTRKIYHIDNDREDTFVFKWNMEDRPVDLSIYADTPYAADVWFWKACRTNPVGYADDKTHRLSNASMPESTRLISKQGNPMYLQREEDTGTSAYRINLLTEYKGNIVLRYINQKPSGSRADVEAKGVWMYGKWTIEFARSLKTGNNDDIQFDPSKVYQFGVSRFEIAGRGIKPELSQPLYGAGDVSETLTLVFADQKKGQQP